MGCSAGPKSFPLKLGEEGDELGEAGREVHGWQVSWEEVCGTEGGLRHLGSPCICVSHQPRPRLFHASALLGDTMVVLGGRSDPDEFSSDVLLYQVNCNTWLLPALTRESLPQEADVHLQPSFPLHVTRGH